MLSILEAKSDYEIPISFSCCVLANETTSSRTRRSKLLYRDWKDVKMGTLKFFKESTVVQMLFNISFFLSGLLIEIVAIFMYMGIRPFSKYYLRKIGYYMCYSFCSHLVFLGDWWSGTELKLYIDKNDFEKYYGKEHGYMLMNHTYEVDWLLDWMFCDKIGVLGNCKVYAKKSVQYIPVFGWALKLAGCVFLERNWDKDKAIIAREVGELSEYPDPMWLLLYAEGTRFTASKQAASEKFAKEKGLPVLKYHLTPRTKGFTESILHLRGKPVAIYDVQVAFDPNLEVKPSLVNMMKGKKFEASIYIKRIPLSDVPEDEEAAAAWLHKLYQQKDKMAESFHKTGDFFATSGVPKPDIIKVEKRYTTLINTVVFAIITLIPFFYCIFMLISSGSVVSISITAAILTFLYILIDRVIAQSETDKTSSSYGIEKKSH